MVVFASQQPGRYRSPTSVNKATSTLINTIPGAASSGLRGTVVRPQEGLDRQQVAPSTPLEQYQGAIKQRLEQAKTSATEQQQKRTDFNKKYSIKTRLDQQKKKAAALAALQKKPRQGLVKASQPAYRAVGTTRGAWGGFNNGNIPVNAMVAIAPGHYMRPDAAGAFARMNAAFSQQFGRSISITDSYRTYASQVRLSRTKPGLAATPGTSNHGWGVALDLGGGINNGGSVQNNWMHQNAAKFGFGPLGGKMGQIEPWHWEYRG